MAWGNGAQRARLADGRWHFQHGPIDLVIAVDGETSAVAAALDAAWARFEPLLASLVAELPLLRRDVRETARVGGVPAGLVAVRMLQAVAAPALRFDLFVTPMAAVAGAVAEHVAECFERDGIRRASVNNGGDIALVLAPGAHWDLGVVADPARPEVGATLRIGSEDRPRGIATSGWHGRSLSMGIADSVTVLADDAPAADTAATLIANEVDLPGHPGILRRPAEDVRDGSDLGRLPVTIGVPALSADDIDTALGRGAAFAQRMIDAGLAKHALLTLQGRTVAVGGVRTVTQPAADAAFARAVAGPSAVAHEETRTRVGGPSRPHVTMTHDAMVRANAAREEPTPCPHRSAS